MSGLVASELLIRIAADMSQLRTDFTEVKKAAQGGLAPLGDIADTVGAKMRQMLGGLSTIYAVKEFLNLADQARQLESRLKLVIGSSEGVTKAQKDIYEVSQRNSVGIAEMTTLYTKLHEPVVRLGGSTRETTAIVEAFSASLKVGGANTQEAASATLQFAQAMASGRLNGDEFRSLAEASPRFMKALADGMGVPIEKLKEMSGQGKLTADVVGNALVSEMAKLRAEAALMPETMGTSFTKLQNEVFMAVTAVDAMTGSSSAMASVIGFIAEMVKLTVGAMVDLFGATNQVNQGFGVTDAIMWGLGKAFEAVVLVGSDVGFVIGGIGREIGGMAAQVAAVLRGDFSGAMEIGAQMRADAEQSRKALDEFQGRISGMTDRVMQSREALREHGLSAGDNAREMDKLARQSGGAAETYTKLRSSVSEADKEAKKAADTYAKLTAKIDEHTASLNAEAATQEKLLPMEKLQIELQTKLANGLLKLTPQQKADLDARLKKAIAIERGNKLLDDEEKLMGELAKENERAIEARGRLVMEIRDQVDAQEDHTFLLGKSNKEVAQHEIAVLRDRAALAARRAELMAEVNLDMAGQYRREAEELGRLANARQAYLDKQAAIEARDAWAGTFDEISQGLYDAILNGGEGAWVRLRETIKRKALEMTVLPLLQQGLGSLGGLLGGLIGGDTGAAISGGADWLKAAGAAKDVYGLWSKGSGYISSLWGSGGSAAYGLTGSTASLGASSGSGLYALGSGGTGSGLSVTGATAAEWGVGSTAAGVGSSAGAAASGSAWTSMGAIGIYAVLAAAAAYMSSKWYDDGYTGSDRFGSAGLSPDDFAGTAYALSGTKTGLKVLNALGVEGKWAEVLSGSVGLNYLFDQMGLIKTPHVGGYAVANADGTVRDVTAEQGGIKNDTMQEWVSSFSTDMLKMVNTFSENWGGDAIIGSIRSVFESDRKDPSWGIFGVHGTDGALLSSREAKGTLDKDPAKGFQQFTDLAAGALLDALKAANLPEWVKGELAKIEGSVTLTELGERLAAIEQVRAAIEGTADAFEPLGGAFANLASASLEAKAKVIELAGGFEAFGQKVTDYVANYYSEGEQMAIAAKQLLADATKAGLGDVMGAFNERSDLRSQLDATDPADAEKFAALLNLSSAFAPIADYLAQNELTLSELADQAPQVAALEAMQSPLEETAAATQRTADQVEQLTETVNELAHVVRENSEQASRLVQNIDNTLSTVFTGGSLQVELA